MAVGNWRESRRHLSRVSDATFYIWKKKYSGLTLSELRELRQLREENGKLMRLVADLSLPAISESEVSEMILGVSEYGNWSIRTPLSKATASGSPRHRTSIGRYEPGFV